jgi:hypothetical protein
LPASAVASLGIGTTGERYSLMAFDGTTSVAQTVRADLVFLRRNDNLLRNRDLHLQPVGKRCLRHNLALAYHTLDDGWHERPPSSD